MTKKKLFLLLPLSLACSEGKFQSGAQAKKEPAAADVATASIQSPPPATPPVTFPITEGEAIVTPSYTAGVCGQNNNLIENCSFEVGLNGASWNLFSEMSGWRTYGREEDKAEAQGVSFEIQQSASLPPYDGLSILELASDTDPARGFTSSNGRIAQMIKTQPQAVYTLSVYYSPRTNSDPAGNRVLLSWDKKPIAEISGSIQGWRRCDFKVTASGPESLLEMAAPPLNITFGGLVDAATLVPGAPDVLPDTCNDQSILGVQSR